MKCSQKSCGGEIDEAISAKVAMKSSRSPFKIVNPCNVCGLAHLGDGEPAMMSGKKAYFDGAGGLTN